jgi:protein-disulfide isomerase
MRSIALLGSLVVATCLLGCGATPQDIEEIKSGQKDILAKIEALSGEVKKVAAARPTPPARPNQPDPNRVVDIPVGDSPIRGKKDAPVTVVEFSDYQCPFCARADPIVEEALKKYPDEIRFVYKQFPLTSIHPFAMGAAKAALAAGKQGKYWEMHDKLFANNRALKPEDLKKYAQEIGVDVAQWEKDMNSPEIQEQINKEMGEGRSAGVRGTPTIFVGGRQLQIRSAEGIKKLADQAQKKG